MARRLHPSPAMLDPVASSLERYMDLLAVRQKLAASNIANADTPGYRTRDIDFQSEFRAAMSGSAPSVRDVEGLETRHDGNNVSVDREARLLAENGIRFQAASAMLRLEVRQVRTAIMEGRSS